MMNNCKTYQQTFTAIPTCTENRLEAILPTKAPGQITTGNLTAAQYTWTLITEIPFCSDIAIHLKTLAVVNCHTLFPLTFPRPALCFSLRGLQPENNLIPSTYIEISLIR